MRVVGTSAGRGRMSFRRLRFIVDRTGGPNTAHAHAQGSNSALGELESRRAATRAGHAPGTELNVSHLCSLADGAGVLRVEGCAV